jgi:predicted nucleotidyltransferase
MGLSKKPKKKRSKGMVDALFSTTKQSVLALIFGQPERNFFATEIIKLAGKGSGSVQRELAMLVESGLVIFEAIGKQKYYRANPDSPVFHELSAIVLKTVGLVGPLVTALRKRESEIVCAFVFGSVAKGSERASSDIDLFVISDTLGLESLYEMLDPAERRIARKISCTLYSRSEYNERRKSGNAFVAKVLASEIIFLIGDRGVLNQLG